MRKPRPTLVYREEVTNHNGRPGSTRQTFDPKQYAAWKKLPRTPETEVHFFVGAITWSEETA
jgi:hypothetical protein